MICSIVPDLGVSWSAHNFLFMFMFKWLHALDLIQKYTPAPPATAESAIHQNGYSMNGSAATTRTKFEPTGRRLGEANATTKNSQSSSIIIPKNAAAPTPSFFSQLSAVSSICVHFLSSRSMA